mmetsp:Transcript_179393/g.569150  ORF Transcript_179393/g.569150 Transcript_179393/m.569150 type:complete len:93 (-) Transcript_179393:425-703(-)
MLGREVGSRPRQCLCGEAAVLAEMEMFVNQAMRAARPRGGVCMDMQLALMPALFNFCTNISQRVTPTCEHNYEARWWCRADPMQMFRLLVLG